MKTEAQPASTIPTLFDIMERVETSLADSAANSLTEEMAGAVAEVFTTDPLKALEPDCAILNLIIFARGCHNAADTFRANGNPDNGELFHVLGQDMLAMAVQALGTLMARGVDAFGTRH